MSKPFEGLEDRIRAKVYGRLQAAGEVVATEAKKAVRRSAWTGRLYKKTLPKRVHRASAPGEAPATDLGGLGRSITVVLIRDKLAVIVKCASGIAPYAMTLEYGSTDGHIAPRPFLGPALRLHKDRVRKMIQGAVKEAIRNA